MRLSPALVLRLLLVAFCSAAFPLRSAETNAPALFPFVLPWDDGVTATADARAFAPAAPITGRVEVTPDGHFAVGGQRLRFLGMNMTSGACFPEAADAPKLATRLSKFGINVVRFHFMDMGAWPVGIRQPGAPGSGAFSSDALERLDRFIAALAAKGIYANVNLLVGRLFNAGDGLPPEIEQMDWKDRQIVACFDPRLIALQKEYARALLARTNRFTGRLLTEDPAVAFVEILNEQGLIHAWLGGDLDRIPPVFAAELRSQWNAWLQRRYADAAALREAWAVGSAPVGEELLRNGSFTNAIQSWDLEQHEGAQARLELVDDLPPNTPREPGARSLRLQVQNPGREGWHLQLTQRPLSLRAGQAYTLRLWVKTGRATRLFANALQNHAPWESLGLYEEFDATPEWKEVRFTFNASSTDAQARISFGRFGDAGTVWIAGVSLRPGGVAGLAPGEEPGGNGVPCFAHGAFGERSRAAQMDWMRFLYETEERYWRGMNDFLKKDLGVRALVTGTIAGCAPLNLMAKMDWVDSHAYWHHPRFPGKPWDPVNWIVENRSMVNEAGGTLPRLAGGRVLGKPFTVTEYNHPAPNTYSSEGFLLLAAMAALQDWDAIYAYTYAHDRRNGWDGRKINGFFDFDQHPTKMATMIPAAALFRRADLAPMNQLAVVPLPVEEEVSRLRNGRNWSLVNAQSLGLPGELTLEHRIAVATGSTSPPTGALLAPWSTSTNMISQADNAQMVWDRSKPGRGVVTLRSLRSKAVIGFAGGQRHDLGGIVVEPGAGEQDGWCAITFTALNEGQPKRWLVTATGAAENTGQRWHNAERSTVGRDWGEAPSRIEGLSAKLTWTGAAAALKAWALDERGRRGLALSVERQGEDAVVKLSPASQTLWYEIVAE